MTKLSADDFPAYFRDVYEYEPFPWQTRLTKQVLEDGKWPATIDLPTGSGKTSVLDTAVFLLACRPEQFPRRVVFVIDRRIIVDQVYKRAEQIQKRIAEADTPVLQQLNEAFSQLIGTDIKPSNNSALLGVVALRGGIPIDSEWTQRPDRPWVVVSTVDQLGSRLLFRGYGVSPKMRPVHAGLAGNDCLLILDEVHLSQPFAQTLANIRADHFGEALPLRKFEIVEMSATPSTLQEEPPFTLVPSDLKASPILRQRVEASKHAALEEIGTAKQKAEVALPLAIQKLIKKNELPAEAKCVGIIVNRVLTAREIHKSLVDAGFNSCLITGRMRPLDRQKVISHIQDLVDPDRNISAEEDAETTYVVATQAIEVGADFSFDALITECAPVNSLKQRFGRLDRRGTFEEQAGVPPKAWILGVKSDLSSKKPDPIYDNIVKATWAELQNRLGSRDFLDVGSQSQDLENFPSKALEPTQKKNAPLLLPTHLNAWVQTNPEPIIQPDITPFLHGKEAKNNTDITFVWRWDHSQEALRLVPPRPAEYLQVPINAAKKWLAADSVAEAPVADTEPFASLEEDDSKRPKQAPSTHSQPVCSRWRGFDSDIETIATPDIKNINPGDILLVLPDRGGLSYGNWDPGSLEEATDLGDCAQMAYQRQVTLRLDDRIYPGAPKPTPESDELASFEAEVLNWLRTHDATDTNLADLLSKWKEKIGNCFHSKHLVGTPQDGTSYYIMQASYIDSKQEILDVDSMAFDGADETFSCTGCGTTLSDHMNGLGKLVHVFAGKLGVSPELQEDLRLAGQLHDLGKVDERFQLQLVGGDPVRWNGLEEPLAKSLPKAAKVWKYPKGMRHEMASIALIESNTAILGEAHDPDLVLHLIATHHGYARPIPTIIEEKDPQKLSYNFNGYEMSTMSNLEDTPIAIETAERFWRLSRKYGHHGLAWLEAIFRLADHRQSESEAENVIQ